MRQPSKVEMFKAAALPNMTDIAGIAVIAGTGYAVALPPEAYEAGSRATLILASSAGGVTALFGVVGKGIGAAASHMVDSVLPANSSQAYKYRLIGGALAGALTITALQSSQMFSEIDNLKASIEAQQNTTPPLAYEAE